MRTVEPAGRDAGRVGQWRVLRAEWTKLRSVPSTAWSLLATAVLVVGIGAGYCLLRVTRPPSGPAAAAAFDAAGVSLTGVQLAQFAAGVLGVLVVTGEYATGTVRTTLTAVPRRLPVLWAKVGVCALAMLAVCVPAAFTAFAVGQSILSAEHLDTTLGAPGTARAVLGSALYLAAVGLLGLSLGALLRTTAAASSALFGALFVPQLLAGLLPETWTAGVTRYLPVPAGVAVTFATPDASSLAPWAGFGLFCGYIAVVLGAAAWRLRHRDV